MNMEIEMMMLHIDNMVPSMFRKYGFSASVSLEKSKVILY